MKEISFLLDRFKHLQLPDETLRKEALLVVKQLCAIELDLADISFKREVLTISADSVVRNELFLKRHKIQKELARRLGDKAPKEIR